MSKAITLISTICAATLLATTANASFPNMTQIIDAHDGAYVLAQTNGQERRDDRQDDRGERQDDRQDCRQEEGVAGKDKRDCKQDERQDGGDASADTSG
jgi:hypothetical protein